MCNNGFNGCSWIIIIVLLLICCGGCGGTYSNDNGCGQWLRLRLLRTKGIKTEGRSKGRPSVLFKLN